MNGKPKSYRAMLLAVAAANHPELDGVDKALLNVLAINADAATGGSSRPGNAMLMASTSLRWSAVHARLEKNIGRGLIECTYKANTRHMASVYRVCLENPAYPDRTPNGEWLIENPPEPPDPGESTVRLEPDSKENLPSGLNRTVNESTIRPDTVYHPANPALPSGESALPSGLDRTTSKSSSKIPTNPPTKTASAPENTSGAGRKGGGVAGWIEKNFATMSAPKGKHKDALDQLAAKHGDDVVTAALNYFLNRPDGFGGVKMPWALFTSEADQYVGQVLKERRQKKDQETKQLRDGERMKAQTLALLETMDPPLMESDRAIIQDYVEKGEQQRTNPQDYFIWWYCDERDRGQLGKAIAVKRWHEQQKREKEETGFGSPLDYL